jgi:hypothetical protein
MDFPIDDFELEYIDRSDFQADITFKSSKLLAENKSLYFQEYSPKLVEILKKLTL